MRSRSTVSFKRMVINFIRLMLVLAIVGSYFSGRDLIVLVGSFGLFFTFVPYFLYRLFRIRVMAEFEIMVLLFLYGLLVFAGVRGFDSLFWWWDPLLTFGASILLGLVGLTLFYVFEREEILEASSFVVILLTFCFAFSIGTLWELFEFFIDTVFGFGLQRSLEETMFDLFVMFFGTFCVSLYGYVNLKSGRRNFVSSFLTSFVRRNYALFKPKKYFEYSSHHIDRLITQGEGVSLEFKSTLRKNLHTGSLDKSIEHAVLKTIVGYLNSSGGTLLVGVTDHGKVVGLNNDEFENHDKLQLYVTSLLRKHIGNHFLPFISSELFPYQDKHVLKISCRKATKPVFLKWEQKEEFFVRHGSSTIQLSGSDLLDYVKEHFEA